MALSRYDAIFKLQQCEERYVDEYFTRDFIIENILPIARAKNRLYYEVIQYPEYLRNKYDIINDTFIEVSNFQTLLEYTQKFVEIQEEPYIYGIRNHKGPLSTETYLIQEELLKFFKKGYITQDSEPGLISNKSYGNTGFNIQKPYLFLMGEKTKIIKIYEAITTHPMLAGIDYDVDAQMDSIFNDFTSISLDEELYMRNTYSFGFFGIRHMTNEDYIKDQYQSYFEYIFSNQFFTDLLEIA
jgi:hypothetical protein